MNIQFGSYNNNTSRLKKVYNQGEIITARPKTTKNPYEILSIKESPKHDENKIKFLNPLRDSISTLNNIRTLKKQSSYVNPTINSSIVKELQSSINFNYNNSILGNNKCLYSPQKKIDNLGEEKKNYFLSLNNEENRQNRHFFLRGFSSTNFINKKKVSSYSLSKYVEKYIDKNFLNNSKSNTNTINNHDLFQINYDDNTQVIHFLSEVINTSETLNNNAMYSTAHNFFRNNLKNKNNTRNLMIQHYYNNYNNMNKISLRNDRKALLAKVKNRLKENSEKIGKYHFFNRKKIFEARMKLKKNNSGKISVNQVINYNHISEDYKKKLISIEAEKMSIINKLKKKIKNEKLQEKEKKEKEKEKESRQKEIEKKKDKNNEIKIVINDNEKKNTQNNQNNDIKKNNIKNNFNKKTFVAKEVNKPQKKKEINNPENNKDNKDLNNIINEKFIYFVNSKDCRGLKQRKNDDISDYLIHQKESEKKNDKILRKDFIEFKSHK